MSYANLILGNELSKPTQDLKVNNIQCQNIDCNIHVVDDLLTQTIAADTPATEISFLNDVNMNSNDLLNVGTFNTQQFIYFPVFFEKVIKHFHR